MNYLVKADIVAQVDAPAQKTAGETVKHIEKLLKMKISKAAMSCVSVSVEEFTIMPPQIVPKKF